MVPLIKWILARSYSAPQIRLLSFSLSLREIWLGRFTNLTVSYHNTEIYRAQSSIRICGKYCYTLKNTPHDGIRYHSKKSVRAIKINVRSRPRPEPSYAVISRSFTCRLGPDPCFEVQDLTNSHLILNPKPETLNPTPGPCLANSIGLDAQVGS